MTNFPISGFGRRASYDDDEDRQFPSMLGLNRLELMARAQHDVANIRGRPPEKPLESQPEEGGSMFRNLVSDPAILLGSGLVRGVGAIAEAPADYLSAYTGILDDRREEGEVRPLILDGIDAIADGMRYIGDTSSSWSQWFEKGLTPDSRANLNKQIFTEESSLWSPSTWEFDDEASFGAAIDQTVRTLGEMAPILIGGVYRASLGALAGGLQSSHYGAEGAEFVLKRAAENGELQNTPGYQERIASGMTELEATNDIIEEGRVTGGFLAAGTGAAGGYALARLASAAGPGRNAISHAASRAGLGGLVEGFQEVAEGYGSRFGVNIAAEQELVALSEGTLNEFVMGALAGAPIGAGLGSVGYERGQDQTTSPQAGPDSGDAGQLALPAPPIITPPPPAPELSIKEAEALASQTQEVASKARLDALNADIAAQIATQGNRSDSREKWAAAEETARISEEADKAYRDALTTATNLRAEAEADYPSELVSDQDFKDWYGNQENVPPIKGLNRKMRFKRPDPVTPTQERVKKAEEETNVEPTDAQIEAGNYKKGDLNWKGLKIKVENPKGSTRSSKPGAKEKWEVTMPATYGYVKGTEGADGDQVDVYVGDNPDSDRVFIIDQVDADTREFDEHKVMIGFDSAQEAQDAYNAAFNDGRGPDRQGGITDVSIEYFKAWLNSGKTKQSLTGIKNPKPSEEQPAPAQDTSVPTPGAKAYSFYTDKDIGIISATTDSVGTRAAAEERAAKANTQKKSNRYGQVIRIQELGENDSEISVGTVRPDGTWNWTDGPTATARQDDTPSAAGTASATSPKPKSTDGSATPRGAPVAPSPLGAASSTQDAPEGEPAGPAPSGTSQPPESSFPSGPDEPTAPAADDQSPSPAPEPTAPTPSETGDISTGKTPDPSSPTPPSPEPSVPTDPSPSVPTPSPAEEPGETSTGKTPDSQTPDPSLTPLPSPEKTPSEAGSQPGAPASPPQEDAPPSPPAPSVPPASPTPEPSATPSPSPSLDETESTTPITQTQSDRIQGQVRDIILPMLKKGTIFKRITEARKAVRDAGIVADDKTVDEGVEEAIVRMARDIAQKYLPAGQDTYEGWREVLLLHSRHPNLNSRTSISRTNQAYSTPAPIAYAANAMADMPSAPNVFEPSGGNGMLLIGSNQNANVTAVELNPKRVESLREAYPNAQVTEGDAMAQENQPPRKSQDVVIANPPFGKVISEEGVELKFSAGNERNTKMKTDQIDHAISMRALKSMKDDGRAVLIVGSVLPMGEDISNQDVMIREYRTEKKRLFFANLYNTYNVTHHIRLDGKLYSKQGAKWPVDMIVIDGRGKSSIPMPMETPPPTMETWTDLEMWLQNNAPGSKAAEGLKPQPPKMVEEPESTQPSRTPGDEAGVDEAGKRNENPASDEAVAPVAEEGQGQVTISVVEGEKITAADKKNIIAIIRFNLLDTPPKWGQTQSLPRSVKRYVTNPVEDKPDHYNVEILGKTDEPGQGKSRVVKVTGLAPAATPTPEPTPAPAESTEDQLRRDVAELVEAENLFPVSTAQQLIERFVRQGSVQKSPIYETLPGPNAEARQDQYDALFKKIWKLIDKYDAIAEADNNRKEFIRDVDKLIKTEGLTEKVTKRFVGRLVKKGFVPHVDPNDYGKYVDSLHNDGLPFVLADMYLTDPGYAEKRETVVNKIEEIVKKFRGKIKDPEQVLTESTEKSEDVDTTPVQTPEPTDPGPVTPSATKPDTWQFFDDEGDEIGDKVPFVGDNAREFAEREGDEMGAVTIQELAEDGTILSIASFTDDNKWEWEDTPRGPTGDWVADALGQMLGKNRGRGPDPENTWGYRLLTKDGDVLVQNEGSSQDAIDRLVKTNEEYSDGTLQLVEINLIDRYDTVLKKGVLQKDGSWKWSFPRQYTPKDPVAEENTKRNNDTPLPDIPEPPIEEDLPKQDEGDVPPFIPPDPPEEPDGWNRPGLPNEPAPLSPELEPMPTKTKERIDTDLQIPYEPLADGKSIGTLVPANMAREVRDNLEILHDEIGDFTAYVADAIGRDPGKLDNFLAAEQIDGAASAWNKIGNGEGFIIADQTGIGKGRQAAAILVAAKKVGKIPIFVTDNPALYGPMIKDLLDIGEKEGIHERIAVTNTDLKGQFQIRLSEDDPSQVIKSLAPKKMKTIMDGAKRGELPEGIDFIFTTYNQQKPRSAETGYYQRSYDLLEVAPHAVLVLDEAHNAGGTAAANAEDNASIASFFRDFIRQSQGVLFLSATYSKNPATMTLYELAGFKGALESMGALEYIVTNGGVPLEQWVNHRLSQKGYLIRRESNFDGITFDTTVVDVGVTEDSDGIVGDFSAIMMNMRDLDEDLKGSRLRAVGEYLAIGGKQMTKKEISQIDSAGFASTMHNLITQMLLTLKAPKVAEQAITALRRGDKPIIYIENTNETMLKERIDQTGAKEGDAISLSIIDVFLRQLKKIMTVRYKDADGMVHEVYIRDEFIPADQRKIRDLILEQINDLTSDWPDAEISSLPIDTIRDRINAAGFGMEEITGRKNVVIDGLLQSKKTGAEANRSVRDRFNSGRLDAVLINQSGSTGISLHAMNNVGPINDGKHRHMIIMQSASNPNVFMQSIGRPNRTGQTDKPSFEFVFADIPAEVRYVSLLLKKLASLNAQVSGARKGQVDVDGADYMNPIGDDVFYEYFDDNEEIAKKLKLNGAPRTDISRKATGRIAILPPREAKEILDEVEEIYNNVVTEMTGRGVNPLQQMSLDYVAYKVGVSVLRSASGIGAFHDATNLEIMSIKRQGKKVSLEEAKETLTDKEKREKFFDVQKFVIDGLRKKADMVYDPKSKPSIKKSKDLRELAATVGRYQYAALAMYDGVPAVISGMRVGKRTKTAKDLKASQIFLEVTHVFGKSTPTISSILNDKTDFNTWGVPNETFEAEWNEAFVKSRQIKPIMTGNLLGGFEATGGSGNVVKFTRSDNSEELGVVVPGNTNIAVLMSKAPPIKTTSNKLAYYIVNHGEIGFLSDKEVEAHMRPDSGGMTKVVVRDTKGYTKLITGRDVVRYIDFSEKMLGHVVGYIPNEFVENLVDIWLRSRNVKSYPSFNSKEEADKALEYFDIKRPEYTPVDIPEEIIAETRGLESYLLKRQEEADKKKSRRVPLEQVNRAPKRSVAELKQAMAKELRDVGLGHNVGVKFSDRVMDALNGTAEVAHYAKGMITMATRQQNHEMSMSHEIIHALRDKGLWGRDNGLFTAREWETLSQAAQNSEELMGFIRESYPDLEGDALIEEAVAEMYARYAQRVAMPDTAVNRALAKIRSFFRAMRRALSGYISADHMMADIRLGRVGSRSRMDVWDPDNPNRVSDLITDAMGKAGSLNILGLVPLQPLVTEVGARIPALRAWLTLKRGSDAERLDIHNKTSERVREWTKLWQTDRVAGQKLNDLMHESTLVGITPTQNVPEPGPDSTAKDVRKYEDSQRLKAMYAELPTKFQSMYWKIRRDYIDMSDRLNTAIEDNINASADIARKRIDDRYDARIDEAVSENDRARIEAQRDAAMAKFEIAQEQTLMNLRLRFESYRKGVYFPLGRYGEYAVNITDGFGYTLSFSLFETSKAQQDYARDVAARPQDFGLAQDIEVSTHLLSNSQSIREAVPGEFVASVENLVAMRDDLSHEAREELMDQIWQTWLRTFPDLSIRKANIHRKGTPGFTTDAIRNFADRSFHAGHQISRTRVGVQMQKELTQAAIQARELTDRRERGQFVVKEVERRHDYWKAPNVAPWAANLNAFTFVAYLGLTPAAAIVNLSQTSILGPGVLGSQFKAQGVRGALRELGKATKDYTNARFDFSEEAMDTKNRGKLTANEVKALKWARHAGLIERTETFALAEMAEEGVQANPNRLKNRILNVMAYSFQASEIANRSVTFLAAYRMSRKSGKAHEAAMDEAWEMTLKMHFDMSGAARPRYIQGDVARVITQFKQFSINIAVRLALDVKKAVDGGTPEEKRQARIMLATTATTFLLHAGIRGLPLYGTVALIMGMFLPGEGGEDDLERLFANMFSEEDTIGANIWNTSLNIALEGPVGALTNTNLSGRIGAAELFFRSRTWQSTSAEAWEEWAATLLGPAWGLGSNFARGMDVIADGDVYRGIETAIPQKGVKDAMKGLRYLVTNEITTLKGNTVERVSPISAVRQAIGFSGLSERYQRELNSRLYNDQRRIKDSRGKIILDAVKSIQAGEGISAGTIQDIWQFNAEYPSIAITDATLDRSLKTRATRGSKTIGGVYIAQPGLSMQLRAKAGTNPYN